MTLQLRSLSRREDDLDARIQQSPTDVSANGGPSQHPAWVMAPAALRPDLVRYLDDAETAAAKSDHTTSKGLVNAKAQLDAWEAKVPARPVDAPAAPVRLVTDSGPPAAASQWKEAVGILLAICAGLWMARRS